jgi:hypothetical protein
MQHELFSVTPPPPARSLDMPAVIERLARVSVRPRYAFMVLNLIARAAGRSGRAGPYVHGDAGAVPLRDWLCDALVPMAARDHRRLALVGEVTAELARTGALPTGAAEARAAIDREVRARVRLSGRSNVSRAVSELVKAGLVTRHYHGYRVDHANRGAQRLAVYTLTRDAWLTLGRSG